MFYSNFVPITHRFWDIRLWKMSWPWNPGQMSLKVIGTDTDRSATYDFLLTLHTTMSLWRYQSKIANFSHPVYLTPPLKGFPLEFGTDARGQKLEWWGYQTVKMFYDRFSRLDTIPACDRRTGGHATTAKTAITHSVARVKRKQKKAAIKRKQ